VIYVLIMTLGLNEDSVCVHARACVGACERARGCVRVCMCVTKAYGCVFLVKMFLFSNLNVFGIYGAHLSITREGFFPFAGI